MSKAKEQFAQSFKHHKKIRTIKKNLLLKVSIACKNCGSLIFDTSLIIDCPECGVLIPDYHNKRVV